MAVLIKYILDLIEFILDLYYCGISLKADKYNHSNNNGVVPYQPCRYVVLSDIFSKLTFSHHDKFLDIGCGKGRVLAYLLRHNFPGTLSGVEIDNDCAQICKIWSAGLPIKIYHQDFFDLDTSSYNVFFLGHPFQSINMFLSLIQKLEETGDKSIIVIDLVDSMHKQLLQVRSGWDLIIEKGDIPWKMKLIYPKHLSYSIWRYDKTLVI